MWHFVLFAGVLHKEVKMTAYWRGLPKVIHSTISVPNYNKPDGYDYYAFSYSKLELMQVTLYSKMLGDRKERSPCTYECSTAQSYHVLMSLQS